MPTIDDIAQKYAQDLRINTTKITAYEIVKKIRSLTYTESGEPISKEAALEIVDKIQSNISKADGRVGMIKESEDSSELIALIKMIRNEVQNGR